MPGAANDSHVVLSAEQDREAGAVSFRFRDGSQENGVPVDVAVQRVRTAIATHALVNTAEDFA